MAARYGRYGAALVRFRALPLVLALALLVGACGDDGEAASTTTTAADPPGTPSTNQPTTGTVAGPTGGQVACTELAGRYVSRAEALFTHEGTPPDALVDRTRNRLAELDTIAGAAGCGDEYRNGVCDGLDALAREGVLVIMALLPPNGC